MNASKLIKKAAEFSKIKHADQSDDDGNPYWNHVAKVAEILQLVTENEEIIAAAYLHDTLEDTKTTREELTEIFGKRVADLVFEVTHKRNSEGEWYFPDLKTKDAILIKFADRLHNLSRMGPWDDAKKKKYLEKSKFWNFKPDVK